ncbi:SAF domain-containing protein [Propioniciclava soli]|uniref:SAF domain-containing protein n=1 Tax=Propioniciclava soli TaxID=2775081 RepID=A0ABZ3C6L0_9ACTN|nr:SAF domain-containing protein [Propioniciclava soli]
MSTVAPDARRPRLRLRRNPLWLLAGILAVALGGLASAYLYTSVASTEEVLRATRTIHRGEPIVAGDLTVVSVGTGSGVDTVPADDLASVVGQRATLDIANGSLLVGGTYGDGALPDGMARVGVRLEAGRFPTGLTAGTNVLVVALPDANAQSASTEQAALPASVPATLTSAPATQNDGAVVIDLTLSATQAESVTRLASANRVSLVEQDAGA